MQRFAALLNGVDMADDKDVDLTATDEGNDTPEVEQRIKDLSGKVKDVAGERDVQIDLVKTRDGELESAKKDTDFFKNFSANTSKYQGAAEYQEQIKEKVDAGYDLEDATIAVLAKEGKYTPPAPAEGDTPAEGGEPAPAAGGETPPVEAPAEPVKPASPAGGSATTQVTADGDKPIKDMTQEERLIALREEEKKGNISLT